MLSLTHVILPKADVQEDLLQVSKTAIKKTMGPGNLNKKANTFLFSYRIIQLITTVILQAECLMNRNSNPKPNVITSDAALHENIFLPSVSQFTLSK